MEYFYILSTLLTSASFITMGMYSKFLYADHPEVKFKIADLPPEAHSYFIRYKDSEESEQSELTCQQLGEMINEDGGWKILAYFDEMTCRSWSEMGKVAQGTVQMHFEYEDGNPFYFHFIGGKTYLYICPDYERFQLKVYQDEDGNVTKKIPSKQDISSEDETEDFHYDFDLDLYKKELEEHNIDFKKNLITGERCVGEGGHPECIIC